MVDLPGGFDAEDEESGGFHFAVHYGVPLFHGGVPPDALAPPILAEVDELAARKPVTPGLPPLRHCPLPSPDALRLIVPQIEVAPPRRAPGIAGQRVDFPVAGPPPVRRLSPAPTTTPAAAIAPDAGPDVRAPTPAPAPEEAFTRPALLEQFDPVFAYLLYMALGLGTLFLDIETRYVALWTVLITLGGALTLLDAGERPERIATANLAWGFGIGLVIGLPILILAGPGLAATTAILFPGVTPATLFQLLALTGPLGETLFFRGVLQDRRGFATSVVAVGLAGVLLYWPAASATPVYLGVAAVFSTALAAVYSYVRTRYGLAAAYVCQATANLMLMFLPLLLTG
jgi:hypothetical protein